MQLDKSELADISHSQLCSEAVVSELESPRPHDNHSECNEASQSTCYYRNRHFDL